MENKAMQQIYSKKEIIFEQGDAANCMYDIAWGSVGIYIDYGTEKEQLITELKEGAFFGEMGLLEGEPRSATAVALEKDTCVRVITGETFASYFEEKPAKVLMIMQHMSNRVRGLTKDYLDACQTLAEAVEREKNGEKKTDGKLKKLAEIWKRKDAQKKA